MDKKDKKDKKTGKPHGTPTILPLESFGLTEQKTSKDPLAPVTFQQTKKKLRHGSTKVDDLRASLRKSSGSRYRELAPAKTIRATREEILSSLEGEDGGAADRDEIDSFRRKCELVKILLFAKDGCTIEELAGIFDVSPRTVKRDLDIFSRVFAGYDSVFGFWGRRYSLECLPFADPCLSLTREDLISFCTLERLAAPLKYTEFGALLKNGAEKIRKHLPQATLDQIDYLGRCFCFIDFEKPVFKNVCTIIDPLVKCMVEGRSAHVFYQSLSKDTATEYDILPYKFIFWFGELYLIGRHFDPKDAKKETDLRLWKLCRFKGIEPQDKVFASSDRDQVDPVLDTIVTPFLPQKPPISIKVRFSPRIAQEIISRRTPSFKKLEYEKTDEGSLLVDIIADPNEGFFTWVKTFGNDIEILSPQSVRDKVAEFYESMAAFYEAPDTGARTVLAENGTALSATPLPNKANKSGKDSKGFAKGKK